MTAQPRHEQDLPQLLAALAAGPRPDYRDSLVEATARTPQRPAWAFPGRWLPMDITARRVQPAPLSRAVVLLVIVAALVAVAVIGLTVASRPRVPAPFGPARNGIVVYGSDGDLYALDPGKTTPRPFLTGRTFDSDPQFSNQGDRVAFVRAEGDRAALYSAAVDGSDVRPITASLVAMAGYAWAPDGSAIAVAYEEAGYPTLAIYRADGSGGHPLALDFAASDPAWRPGHDGQLLVRGQAQYQYDLYLVDVSTGQATPLGIPHESSDGATYDGQRASWSPDGSQVVFEQGLAQRGTWGGPVIRLRVADVADDGTMSNVRPLELDPGSDYEYLGRWLSTGDRFAFATQKACVWQVYVTNGLDMATAKALGEPFEDCTNDGIDFELSPDATQVVTVRGTTAASDPMWIGRTDGTGRRKVDGTITDVPTWQRQAP